jgi:hypothetical protein
MRHSVVLDNLDEKWFAYVILSQFNPEKLGGNKLEVKDDTMHYHNVHELQAYAQD